MHTSNTQHGFSTLELLIAFSIIILTMSAVIVVVFGNQATAVDTQTSNQALGKAQGLLEDARATALADFGSVQTKTWPAEVPPDIYQRRTIVDPLRVTQCGKDVTSQINWVTGVKPQLVQLTTHISDIPTAVALGGNCDSVPPSGGWNPPVTYNCANFNPGKPTGLDVFGGVVYISGDKTPFLYINNTNGEVLNSSCQQTSSPPFITFTNGFDDGVQLNDVAVARLSDNNLYIFVARDIGTEQFEVIHVSNPQTPVSVIKRSLLGISGGSQPQAFRVFYFDKRVYVVTRETAGPELHIFDVSHPETPSSIVELGIGKELNRTAENLVVTKKNIGGVVHYIAYMATDKNSAELSVFDVTNPAAISEVTASNKDLPGNNDASSLFLVGNTLYVGRLSTVGSDLFIYDATTPLTGLALLGQQDIGTSALDITVSGRFAFIATSKSSNEFQVWNSDPQNLTLIATFNFPNVITNGLKYENNFVYLASQGNDALRILYSP